MNAITIDRNTEHRMLFMIGNFPDISVCLFLCLCVWGKGGGVRFVVVDGAGVAVGIRSESLLHADTLYRKSLLEFMHHR